MMASSSLTESTTLEMALFTIQLPEPFSLMLSNEWPKWKRRFQRFHTTSGLHMEPHEDRVGTFLHIVGDLAEDIFSMFQLSATEAEKLSSTLAASDGYFVS